MSKRSWWPPMLAAQLVVVQNIKAKISNYAAALGWTAAQILAVETLCDEIIQAINYADASKTTAQAVTQWRDQVMYGDPMDAVAGPTPEFEAPADMTFHRGCVDRLSKYRELIMANFNYTVAMGEDLSLIGPEIPPPNPATTQPNMKLTVTQTEGFQSVDKIVMTGSMQKMSAVQFIYTPKGGVPRDAGMFTSMPATLSITKTDPNEPESGTVQAQFYKNNVPFGIPSPVYPVTLT